MPDPNDAVVSGSFGASATITAGLGPAATYLTSHAPRVDEHPVSYRALLEEAAAETAITQKAAQLGGLPGEPTADTESVRNGWKRIYAGCDILYGKDTGAHEVHGDIRSKYNALQGAAGVLGLPLTDETGTPDGIGRFNHFQGGSIYWTPSTGPMMVRGTIRDAWATQGWERGPLGYPVADEYRIAPLHPNDHPKVAWSLFENGAIVENAEGTHQALAAELPADEFRRVVRTFFDRKVHESPDNIGLQPPVETLAVSGYSYGFWRSVPRTITFRLHGFHDNGLAPDTDFELDVRLRFGLVWSAGFTEPTSKTLVTTLDWIRVSAHGLASGSVANGVADGVKGAFARGGPDPQHPDVPDGAVFIGTVPTGASQTGDGNIDVVDVLVTPQGSLQVLVPVGPIINGNIGTVRQLIAQNAINALAEG